MEKINVTINHSRNKAMACKSGSSEASRAMARVTASRCSDSPARF